MSAPTNDRPEPMHFQRIQREFIAHIREPDRCASPADVEERRMTVYRELFYNNVEDFISSNFPVLRSLLDDEYWHSIIRDYFARHRAHTPLFPEMPREFVHYLEHERATNDKDPAFLLELAHYEWMELALSLAGQTTTAGDIDPHGNLLEDLPVLSSLAWQLHYRYPVHRIGPEFMPGPGYPQTHPATHLVVYRNSADDIGFLELNPVSARLLEQLAGTKSGNAREILLDIAGELEHPNPDTVVRGGLAILEDLHALGVIAGVRKRG